MVSVIKATGKPEYFSEEKLRYSIHRAGIPDSIQNEVVTHIKSKLYENIPTSEIYKHITEFLSSSNKNHMRAKYSLKQAIMDLGPTGYPFEDFIAELLKAQGYVTQVRTILMGTCISHEIDVIAEKDGKKIMIEAKYHNGSGTRTDSHVALYTKARFDDVKNKHLFNAAWLITNTKATIDAMSYGDCTGLKVSSWSLPEGGSIRELVEKTQLFPLTALTNLTQNQKQILLNNHVILCKTICTKPEVLSELGLSPEEKKEVLKEAELICSSH